MAEVAARKSDLWTGGEPRDQAGTLARTSRNNDAQSAAAIRCRLALALAACRLLARARSGTPWEVSHIVLELCCCSHPSTARSPRALRAQRALHIVTLRWRRVKCAFSRSSSVRAGCESWSNISCGSSLYDSTSTLDCIKIIAPVHLKFCDSGV